MGLLVDLLCEEGEDNLVYLGPTISNLSQLPDVRTSLLCPNTAIVQRLLPFTTYHGSVVKRGGVVGALRNLCFSPAHHPYLMGKQVIITLITLITSITLITLWSFGLI